MFMLLVPGAPMLLVDPNPVVDAPKPEPPPKPDVDEPKLLVDPNPPVDGEPNVEDPDGNPVVDVALPILPNELP
jgi:hypothetical protein